MPSHELNSNIISPVPPKIVSDAGVRVEPGSQVPCSPTGTLPIYIALIRNYTCVAVSKYGTDVKPFVIKGDEKKRYFETNTMHTELRLSHNRDKGRDSRRADSAPKHFHVLNLFDISS